MKLFTTASILCLATLAACGHENAPLAPPMVLPAAPDAGPALASPRVDIVIDARGTRLSDSDTVLVPAGSDPARGADAAYKRSGPNDLYLVPLVEPMRRALADKTMTLPVRVVADERTPYRTLLEALFTAGQNEVSEFELCEKRCELRSFSFRPPSLKDQRLPSLDRPTFSFSVIIVADGFLVKAMGASVGPGCDGIGRGITIPRAAGAIDVAALERCAAKLRAKDAAFADDPLATLSANGEIPFHDVMDAALALRGKVAAFRELWLAVPR